MFRGKESSNRIELSRLVQDLLNFGVLGSLRLWGEGRWVGGHLGAWGVSPHTCTCMHTHAHAHTHIYTWPPTWRHPCLACLACLTCMCVRVCMHACACVCMHAWDIPPHTYTNPHPHPSICYPPQGGEPLESLKI